MKIRIENVTLFDGINKKVKNTAVLFDKSIIAVGEGALKSEADEVIDGCGMTCLPGFINMHAHLSVDSDADFGYQVQNDTPGIAAVRALKNAYRHVMAGVVTVRALGAKYDMDIEIRNTIDEGAVKGPRIFASGHPLTMTGGHGHAFAVEVDGEDEIRKAARLQIKKGADIIKLMATGGGLTKGVKPGASQLSEEEMRVACTEALKAGKTTAAHAQGNSGIKNAIRAGITTIEHGVELDDEAISLMKERGTYLVATLAAPYHIVKHGVEGGIPEWAVEKNRQALVPHRESFRKAYKAGVKIAAGTDAGTPFNGHADFATELELMILEGMTVFDVVKSATYMGAEALGIEKYTGSIETGKWADVVLIEGDPEEDNKAFRNVVKVFKEGECLFDRDNKYDIRSFLNL